MIQVEELFLPADATVLEALRKLDETGQRILFIAPQGKLEAALTDGDIRKFFLRGGTPDQAASLAANYHPLSLPIAERGRAREVLQKTASTPCLFWISAASLPILCLLTVWMWTTASTPTFLWS